MPFTSVPPRHAFVQVGSFILGSILQDTEPILINGTIHITCTILKLVAALAAEAELGALFLNSQKATICPQGTWTPAATYPLSHQQHYTVGNNTIKQLRLWAIEMQYYWLLDAKVQKLIRFHYQLGQEKLGDYPSKYHSANIHQHVCQYNVHMNNSPTVLP
jgi:hypothetical protein